MQWFRMYGEFSTDPKVQSMDETLQRRFVMFLCLHCSGEYEQLNDDELAFALRISNDELARTREAFRSKGFLDSDNRIANWNKRQYKSDDVSARVKKHRDQKKKRTCNVTVSPSDTDTDTDTDSESDTEKKKKTPSESLVPQKRDAGPAERVFDHWRQEFRHPRAVLDAKRRKVIAAALVSFDEATVCSAISGYKLSPHHMGENNQRTVYDDIELFLRDVSHIERGLNFARAPPKPQMSAVERAREKLRNGNGNGRVVSEQFGGSSESGMGPPAGMLRRIPDQ